MTKYYSKLNSDPVEDLRVELLHGVTSLHEEEQLDGLEVLRETVL